ncbi:MAG: rod shape-determining protein [Clostridia bacterium]|nr:rod shape-determining protein [Clostridia bacterium]
MKNLTYVLDIGSSKISLLACCVKKGNSAIVTSINKAYDGFMDGEFFSNDEVSTVIIELLAQMKERVGDNIKNIHIGVPSEFCACVCKRVTRNFVPAKRIEDRDVASLFDGIGGFKQKDDYLVISYSPLQYELDKNVVSQLSNKRVSQFVMDCSYILVKKQFVELMQTIFDNCGIKEVDFISIALAQAQFAMAQVDNNLKPIVIVDIGHITTSVAIAKGEGLLMLSSFSLGGGHITADLMQVNNLGYNEADSIKHKVSLTVQSKKDEKYIVYSSGKPIKALINITNDIVKARIENIANVVNKVLAVNDDFKDLPIYITGDGVCNFRGIVNLFEAVCERKVYILKSPLHNDEDKYQTSKIGLVNIIGDLV